MSAMEFVGALEAGRLTPMVSDAGPHSVEKWAHIAVLEILLGEAEGTVPQHAALFGARIFEIVRRHMKAAIAHAKAVLDAYPAATNENLIADEMAHATDATAQIVAMARSTPFANTCAESAARGHIAQVIGQRLTDTIHDHLQHWRLSVAETAET